MKKYYDFTFELHIDGQPYPPAQVAPLFQRNPYPGGHKYSCVITGKRLSKHFDYVPLKNNENVAEEEARRLFLSVSLGWTQIAEEGGDIEYFLNSVKKIYFDGEQLRISGECSPVVCSKDGEA